MTKKPGHRGGRANVPGILAGLRKQWPEPRCELNHASPFQLMIGVILSAQSADKRVNEVTPDLFKKYPTPQAYLDAGPTAIENDIRSTGFFRSKTKSIRGACRVLIEKFGGKMPKTMDELLELPGIGRKSANVILGADFGVASGIVVDTHMIRLSHRLGLSKKEEPVKIEVELNEQIPQKDWIYFSQSMVLHGRYICIARNPRCFDCELIKACPFPDKMLAPKTKDDLPPSHTIVGIPIHRRPLKT